MLSPVSSIVRPFGMKAPKLCPPAPLHFTVYISSSNVSLYFFVISEPKIVPNDLSIFVTSTSTEAGFFCSRALPSFLINTVTSFVSSSLKSYTFFLSYLTLTSAKSASRIFERQTSSAFPSLTPSLTLSKSTLPTNSSTVLIPSFAIYSRNS